MRKRRISWPYLDFYLQLPLLSIVTQVMYERFETDTLEYIGLFIKVWKWEWKFRLYSPRATRR